MVLLISGWSLDRAPVKLGFSIILVGAYPW